jgi:hypothetical protein
MSFIRCIYCINPLQYYWLCPSFRAQSFRNWSSSFCGECVQRPAVPNSQEEQSSLFQPITWRRESKRYSKHCASVKKKNGRGSMNELWSLHTVFTVWPLKDLHLHSRTYIRKNSLEIPFKLGIFWQQGNLLHFSNTLLYLSFTWCKIPFFIYNLDLCCSNFTVL